MPESRRPVPTLSRGRNPIPPPEPPPALGRRRFRPVDLVAHVRAAGGRLIETREVRSIRTGDPRKWYDIRASHRACCFPNLQLVRRGRASP